MKYKQSTVDTLTVDKVPLRIRERNVLSANTATNSTNINNTQVFYSKYTDNLGSNMNEFTVPVHSTRNLVKAGVIALLVAILLLVTCILPAEYNIDPTGIGEKLGLTAIAQASEKSPTLVINRGQQTDVFRSDSVEIVIPAGKGLEYKLYMEKYAHVAYEWQTDGEALYFDFHGEPAGDTTGYFESFAITTSNNMKGSLTAPFKGAHGWYWKNQGQKAITVTLTMQGYYTIKG
jgi:hypothetical protein